MRALLKAAYGESYRDDYSDNPADPLSKRIIDPNRYMAQRLPIPNGSLCVHGHFHPGKYFAPDDGVRFTMLRHPVENILSIYWFWRTMRRGNDALHSYFLDNNLTIIETAKLPLLRHLFSVTYFGGFDMGRFDLIGRHESREVALTKLSALIEVPLDIHVRENTTAPTSERQEMSADVAIRRQLEDVLSDDIKFYEAHVI